MELLTSNTLCMETSAFFPQFISKVVIKFVIKSDKLDIQLTAYL